MTLCNYNLLKPIVQFFFITNLINLSWSRFILLAGLIQKALYDTVPVIEKYK